MKRLILILILATSITTRADSTLPFEYLNKISERLTGKWPTREEFADLETEMSTSKCSEIPCLRDYFRGYIKRKMDTPEFYSEASLKVQERFALRSSALPPFPLQKGLMSADVEIPYMIYRVFKLNRPLDELYAGQKYFRMKFKEGATNLGPGLGYIEGRIDIEGSPSIRALSATELNELRELSGFQSEEIDYTGHPNIAGLFSTGQFLQRYWNTPVNGNRKRAAAVFRILLCDNMSPALEREKQKPREEALALGVSESQASTQSLEQIHRNRHGNQADCRQCHVRLDPMARTMRPMELGISKFALPGRLNFYSSINHLESIPVKGFADLVKTATQQQRYVGCQVNWLSNWLIGKDVHVSATRVAQWNQSFERDGRRVKDIIENIILSPEFYDQNHREEEPESLSKARKVLTNCQYCHGPFLDGGREQLKSSLNKIAIRLDLANDGVHRSMPPNGHWWQPTIEDLTAIKAWIQKGAPMEAEESPTLSPEEVDSLLKGRSP